MHFNVYFMSPSKHQLHIYPETRNRYYFFYLALFKYSNSNPMFTCIPDSTNEYMAMDMSGQTSNSISRLESPWMCPMGDHQYSLSFQFYYGSIQKCELTLFLVTDSNVSCMVWKGTEDTSGVFKKSSTFLTANETVFRRNKFKVGNYFPFI